MVVSQKRHPSCVSRVLVSDVTIARIPNPSRRHATKLGENTHDTTPTETGPPSWAALLSRRDSSLHSPGSCSTTRILPLKKATGLRRTSPPRDLRERAMGTGASLRNDPSRRTAAGMCVCVGEGGILSRVSSRLVPFLSRARGGRRRAPLAREGAMVLGGPSGSVVGRRLESKERGGSVHSQQSRREGARSYRWPAGGRVKSLDKLTRRPAAGGQMGSVGGDVAHLLCAWCQVRCWLAM